MQHSSNCGNRLIRPLGSRGGGELMSRAVELGVKLRESRWPEWFFQMTGCCRHYLQRKAWNVRIRQDQSLQQKWETHAGLVWCQVCRWGCKPDVGEGISGYSYESPKEWLKTKRTLLEDWHLGWSTIESLERWEEKAKLIKTSSKQWQGTNMRATVLSVCKWGQCYKEDRKTKGQNLLSSRVQAELISV